MINMIKNKFAKVAGAAVIGLSLAGCQTTTGGQFNAQAVGTIGGALIGANAAKNKGTYERAIYTAGGALIGNVIGGAFTPPPNPCVTRTTGTVTERNGRTSQQQQTQYECNSQGAPASANPPQFRRY